MMRNSAFGLLAAMALADAAIPAAAHAPCPLDAAGWHSLSAIERARRIAQSEGFRLAKECLHRIIDIYASADRAVVMRLLESYERAHDSLDTDLLLHAAARCAARSGAPSWIGLVSRWEKRCGFLEHAAAAAQQSGDIARADSFFIVLESVRHPDAYGYMRWAQILAVRADYAGAAQRLCRACQRDPRIAVIAANQLERMLDEADSTDPGQVLGTFDSCMRQVPIADRPAFDAWIGGAYARCGLIPQAVAALAERNEDSAQMAQQLLAMAQTLAAQRRFGDARIAALAAWQRHATPAHASACAMILYQSYIASNNLDSARIWLARADLDVAENKGAAIMLYQRCGLLRTADSLIATLPQGMLRDTLEIRQAWFAGNVAQALELSARLSGRPSWRNAQLELELWRVRALLFAAKDAAMEAIDSLALSPSWPHAAEILACQYRRRLVRTATDRDAWAAVALACYLAKPGQVASSPALRACSPQLRLILVSDLVKSCITHRKISDALALLEGIADTLRTAEHRYLLGETLMMSGELERGRRELERLILAYPQDVFSSKARILLSRLDQS